MIGINAWVICFVCCKIYSDIFSLLAPRVHLLYFFKLLDHGNIPDTEWTVNSCFNPVDYS